MTVTAIEAVVETHGAANANERVSDMEQRFSVRPLGGGVGCLAMILISVVASVVLTVVANLLIR